MDTEEKKELKVKMFGKFQVTGMNGELGVTCRCPKRIVKLMAYIFSHHKENLSISKIADALYGDMDLADPISATRNLIWRLRSTFREAWGANGDDFLITKGSDYHWNEDIVLFLDSEQMDFLDQEAEEAETDEEKTEKYLQAAALYTGSYLEGYDDMYWGAYLSVYYHTMYLQIVKKLAVLLDKQERYEELQRIMNAALEREQLDEELYVWLIRSLMKLGYMGMALDEYKKATSILYENLGYTSMEQLREVHSELMGQMHEEQNDLKAVLDDLEDDPAKGAFLCEYGEFKKIYQLELRRAGRLGISVFLSLISVRICVDGTGLSEEEKKKRLIFGMKKLQEVLLSSLRSGDVVARYSVSQYILLLPTCQYETAGKVMRRIENVFYRYNRGRGITMKYQLKGLDQ